MRRSSKKVPLLAVPVLAGGDGVDDTALSFLVKSAVEDRKKEEKEKERKKSVAAARAVSSSIGSFQAHVERSAQQADLQAARAAVAWEQRERSQEVPKRRKRKKRRRRRRSRPGTSCW